MYHTTGLDKAEILDLCEMIHQESVSEEQTWPPILGLYKSVVVTLTYLRRNRVQAEIAEAFEVSQSTISRAITALTGLVERALRRYVPTADELDDSTQYVVDGTLLPCWSWAAHPELRSGKHKTTGLNVQILGTLDGELVWISDPVDGSRHDTYCLRDPVPYPRTPPATGPATRDTSALACSLLSRSRPTGTCWTARKRSTPRSTRSAMSSNRSSRTLRPGGSCTPTTGDHSTRSPRRSQPLSAYISIDPRE
jgi:hypothetical protein